MARTMKKTENGNDYSYPYHVRFTYVVTPKDALMKLSVNDIQLIGEKTGTHHTLKDIQGDKVRVYGERKFIRISAGPLTADESITKTIS